MSEVILHEIPANTTIPALSLNLWHGVANGTGTRIYNVYHFQRHLNFFLPYGLCLLFTLPIVATGLITLRHNGISAIGGGFLQIPMTAATGPTEVETAAGKGCLGGYENISDELRKLKGRFEELVTYETTTEDVKAPDAESAATSRGHHGTEANETGEDIVLMRLSQERGTSDDQDQTASQAEVASGIEKHDMERAFARRAGFGIFSETKPLRRGGRLGDSYLSVLGKDLHGINPTHSRQ